MEIVKNILAIIGVIALLNSCTYEPSQYANNEPLTVQDCISTGHTGQSINVGCIQRVNAQYGY